MGEALISRRGGGDTKVEYILTESYQVNQNSHFILKSAYTTHEGYGYLNPVYNPYVDFNKREFLVILYSGTHHPEVFHIKKGEVIFVSGTNPYWIYNRLYNLEVNFDATDDEKKIIIRGASDYSHSVNEALIIALS